MKTKGLFWHVHHDVLCEWSDDIRERIRFIKAHKPKSEHSLRLKLLKPVKGRMAGELTKTWEAYLKADKAHGKALAAYARSRDVYVMQENYSKKARDAYRKAGNAINKTMTVCNEMWCAYERALHKQHKHLNELHRKECKNCPWNGRTIFPRRRR